MSDELRDLFGNIDFENDPDRGAGILLEWIKHSPNIVGLVQAITPEIQELNDAQQDVFATINIFEAIGSQLDDIFGEILDTPRSVGQLDEDYRADLLSAIARLAKSGDIITMKAVFRNLFAATSVSLFEYQPAAFKIEGIAPTIPSESQLTKIRETLTSSKQGGNNLTLSISDSETPFTLGEFDSPQLNDPLGLSGDGFDGGILSEGF